MIESMNYGIAWLTNFLKEIDFFCDNLSVRSSRKPRSLKQSSMLHLKSIYLDELDLQTVTKTERICVSTCNSLQSNPTDSMLGLD